MQFDAAIKIDDPQPPSPAQWTLVGQAQSLGSAAAHGQVLQGLCFSVFSYRCCDLQGKTSGFKYTFLITKLPAPAFGLVKAHLIIEITQRNISIWSPPHETIVLKAIEH